jgi:hypothetical protein
MGTGNRLPGQVAHRTHMESQWLAKSLKAVQFSLRLLHLRVFRFHCAEQPEMWDFNWDIFLGLLACGAFKFGVTGPPTGTRVQHSSQKPLRTSSQRPLS